MKTDTITRFKLPQLKFRTLLSKWTSDFHSLHLQPKVGRRKTCCFWWCHIWKSSIYWSEGFVLCPEQKERKKVFFYMNCLLNLCFLIHWFGQSRVFPVPHFKGEVGRAIQATVLIHATTPMATTDDNYICATLDWWPTDKCDFGTCSWDRASLLNLDLGNPILLNAVKAFSPLKIRMGGTLQDRVIYETEESDKQACKPFVKSSSKLLGFSKGCLPMGRWDELNAFFNKAGAVVTFGLNALTGRHIASDGSSTGAWDSSNAGNELCGSGIGTSVAVDQYASDVNTLEKVVQNAYKQSKDKPKILAPGGFLDEKWFSELISNAPPTSIQVVTQHIYNLGPGSDSHLIEKILNPSYLEGGKQPFSSLQKILNNSGTSAVAWVGEAGGASNSGRSGVTNTFVFSFWYLDQLGMAASYDTKTYCRQTLIGGNYGLLNTDTFVPNPDYYSALLWHRLMGSKVLKTSFSGTNNIRAYAHCSKVSHGITLLMINLDANTTVQVIVSTENAHDQTFASMPPSSKEKTREEYHLTPKNGDLQSHTMLLNGKELTLGPCGRIPPLLPVTMSMSEPITVAPHSIVFSYMSSMKLPACK